MPPKRMTANPLKPSRHRAGKHTGAESSSDSDADEATTAPAAPIPPPPKAASAGKIISNLSKVDLNARRQEAQVAEAQRLAAEKAERLAAEDGFVTEDESGADDGGGGGAQDEADESDEEESSEDEESSEEEAPRRMMLRPKFVPKSQRGGDGQTPAEAEEAARLAAETARKQAADALVEEQIKKDLAARAAGKKHWDDDEDAASDVDTTDGLDPAAEEAAWRVRELKRLKRARAAIEEREAELAEVERRRNLTAEERAAEDAAFLAQQQQEKDAKGTMGYMQKYFHKGAFFRDEAEAAGLLQRDLMGARIADDVRNREALPEYLQRRDMTKLGRKGATKYKDMRTEDTGSWGADRDRRGGAGGGRGRFEDDRFRTEDERFRPDDHLAGGKGANAMPLGERRRDGDGRRSRSPRRERREEDRGSRKRSRSRERGEDKRRRVEADR
ncbi:microfibrillar-associated 1 [Cordyceps militaris]|uniref:Microfibrillar-associated 1 n=1 Tax=Cordyceps militaris TaxID=73501 RepID=A0A2H4SAA0_CORMI|nr:microfibrillar-associated 1 [Cordyceps militaris]